MGSRSAIKERKPEAGPDEMCKGEITDIQYRVADRTRHRGSLARKRRHSAQMDTGRTAKGEVLWRQERLPDQ